MVRNRWRASGSSSTISARTRGYRSEGNVDRRANTARFTRNELERVIPWEQRRQAGPGVAEPDSLARANIRREPYAIILNRKQEPLAPSGAGNRNRARTRLWADPMRERILHQRL
jgi:hypothetical protein